MVRNDKGGKGAKSLARKAYTSNNKADFLQISSCEEEQYACVTNMFGNGMCEVYTNDNVKLICHIRSKFRGRQKRNNMVVKYSIVMVGLRDYENPPKNCDLLCIYDDNQIEQLTNNPNINIQTVLKIRTTNLLTTKITDKTDDDVIFTNDIDEEDEIISNNKSDLEAFTIDNGEAIDIDDI
jgi:translation initiation factor IF-1